MYQSIIIHLVRRPRFGVRLPPVPLAQSCRRRVEPFFDIWILSRSLFKVDRVEFAPFARQPRILQNFIHWCGLVWFGALRHFQPPFANTGLNIGCWQSFFISCVLRIKIIFPQVRAQLEIIPGFLASLFNFLIGFRIPLCLCHLCAKNAVFKTG